MKKEKNENLVSRSARFLEIWSGVISFFFLSFFFLFSWIRGPFSDDDVAKSGKRRKEFGWGCLVKMKCYSRVLALSTRNALLRGVLLRALLGRDPLGLAFSVCVLLSSFHIPPISGGSLFVLLLVE